MHLKIHPSGIITLTFYTLRQRVSRLVRKTLSFSKKLENHIGAIWNFIHHYNLVIGASAAPFTADVS